MSTYLHGSTTAGFLTLTAFSLDFGGVASAAEVAKTLRYGIKFDSARSRTEVEILEN